MHNILVLSQKCKVIGERHDIQMQIPTRERKKQPHLNAEDEGDELATVYKYINIITSCRMNFQVAHCTERKKQFGFQGRKSEMCEKYKYESH